MAHPEARAPTFRAVGAGLGRGLTHPVVEVLCGALGVFLLGVTIWAGLTGPGDIRQNFAGFLVLVLFWVGFVFASVAFGDVFRLFNPWRAAGRAVGWAYPRITRSEPLAPFDYPDWLGRWPAAAGLVGFTLIELVTGADDDPHAIAVAALIYSAITAVGMMAFGVQTWTERGEAFSVYFNLFSRMSVFERRGREIGLRRPLAASPPWSRCRARSPC